MNITTTNIVWKKLPVLSSLIVGALIFLPKAAAKTPEKSDVYTIISADSIAEKPISVIQGRVLDKATKKPLSGATIALSNSKKGTLANKKGEFTLEHIPIGTYSLRASMVGYAPLIVSDIVVRSGRTTSIEIELEERITQGNEVVVTEGYFRPPAASTTELSFEELRRSPGTAGDINRAMVMIPSAVQLDDEGSDLIVRGGAPFENGYYIDHIFAPNINHFPQMGAAGGNISMLNLDFVQHVSFMTGGFSAGFGNRLSSIMDISLRKGNNQQFEGQLDFNMAGFGGQIEGPIGSSGTFMLSAKRSYFDIIAGFLNFTGAPRFGDAQTKITWDVSEKHSLTVLSIWGLSQFSRSREEALDDNEFSFGHEDYLVGTNGIAIRSLWNDNLFSNTSVSLAHIRSEREFSETMRPERKTNDYLYRENIATIRNTTTWKISPEVQMEFGGEYQQHRIEGENMAYIGAVPQAMLQTGALFAQATWHKEQLQIDAGFRLFYNSPSATISPEPRLGVRLAISEAHSLYASFARVHQAVPIYLLIQSEANSRMEACRADHLVGGWRWLLAEDMQLVTEVYHKNYGQFPIAPTSPLRFPTDDVAGDDDDFNFYRNIVSEGVAQSYGAEVILTKKMSDSWYGIIGASYMRSRYKDGNGVWRNRLFDHRFIMNATLGWRINDSWEISARWLYVGGRATTPIDIEKSRRNNRTEYILQEFMQSHLPAYHSLNIRADKRWNFFSSNLITYISVMNAYNASNVRGQYWDSGSQSIRQQTQLPLIPLIGIEYEL